MDNPKPISDAHLKQASNLDGRHISPEALEKLRATMIEVFSQGLFHQVGIRDICQRAQVSSKTVYKYFGNKDQLLAACVEQDLEVLTRLTSDEIDKDDSAAEQFKCLIEVFFAFYQARPEIARMVFLNVPIGYWVSSQSPAHRRHQLIGYEIFKHGLARGELRQDISPILMGEFMAGGLNRVLSHWIYRRHHLEEHTDLREQAEATFKAIWYGFAKQD